MSKLTTASISKQGASKQATATADRAHVLITEQEVLFGTAAAVPLQRRRRFDIISRFVSSARARSAARAERKPIRHDHPSRLSYLEHSMMSREMDRL